jgi:diguanylate cyclase (GGDEF)-like protein
LQPLEDLIAGVLTQIQGLLGFSGAFVATVVNPLRLEPTETGGLVAMTERDALEIRVATGRFRGKDWQHLDEVECETARSALRSKEVQNGSVLVLPLIVADRVLGVVLVDHQLKPSADLKLLEIFTRQAAVAIENVKLYELATVDDLTRLLVRRHWFYLFENSLRLAVRHNHPTSVLMLDIDHFKKLNDSYGHMAGDAVLKALGHVLLAQLRKSDLIGRYGGEEITIALPHTGHAQALLTAEKLRQTIEGLIVPWQGQTITIQASIGVSSIHPTSSDDMAFHDNFLAEIRDRLIDTADQALYTAKQSGRNRVIGKLLNLQASAIEPV